MKVIVKGLFLVVFLNFAAKSLAVMSLDRMIVYFKPNKVPHQDVIVSNPDNENMYLQTEVYKVVNPGTDKEERVRIADPSAVELLATPNKAIIPPNSTKTVRLVSLGVPKEKELVYRVTFRPVIGDVEVKKTSIKLLIAYQALVFVQPEKPEYKVTASVKNGNITFINSGNTNVVLRNGKYCTSKQLSSCTDLIEVSRIYAGESWEMPIPEQALKVAGKEKKRNNKRRRKKENGFIKYGMFDGEFEKVMQFPI